MIKEIYNEYTGCSTEDLGAKILPTNLNEAIKRAYYTLNNFNSSSNLDTSGIIHINNNNIREDSYNISYNSILYHKCPEITLLQEKAKELMLVDIHWFPVVYKGERNKLKNYLKYNLNTALISMVVNTQNYIKLIELSSNVKLRITRSDITSTLNHLARTMSKNFKNVEEIVSEAVQSVLNGFDNDKDFVSFYTKNYNNWATLTNIIIGMDNYIADKIGYNHINYNEITPVRVYGAEKDEAFTSIKLNNCDEICLYITPDIKKMLKRIKSSMSGQKFHKYINELIGKWFTIEDKAWGALNKGISRVNDDLEEMYNVESCKVIVSDYFDGMARYYDGEMVEESDDTSDFIDSDMKELMEEEITPMPIKVDNLINTIESKILPDFDAPVAVEPQIIEPHIDTNTAQEIDNTDEDLDFEALKAEGKLIQQSNTTPINTNNDYNEDTDFFNDIKKRYGND